MPRCAYPGDLWRREARYWHGAPPVAEEEVEALRSQAEALKERLTEIERRIHDLERKEGA
jgi:hypothetical protein